MNDVEFILDLFFENRGRIEQLQNLAYKKAIKENHPILKTFSKRYFGMYSSRIKNIVDMLTATNFIGDIWFKEQRRYFLTDDGLFVYLAERNKLDGAKE